MTLDLQEVMPEHLPMTFTVTADEHGVISNQPLFIVAEHHLGVRFYLTARDAASQAQVTFTDSQPNAVNVAAPTTVTVGPGGSATYGTVTVTMGGNSNPCTVTLGVQSITGDTGLPAGATPSFGNGMVTGNGPFTSSFIVATANTVNSGTFTFHIRANTGSNCQNGGGNDTSVKQLTLVVKRVGAVTVGSQVGTLTTGTAGAATYSVTVNRNGSSATAFTANLSVTSSLPAGATASFSPSTVSFAVGETSKTSTLTINTTAATPSGSTAFTVQAANPSAATDFSSGTGTLTIGAAATTTTTASNATATYGDASVTLSATVAPSTVNAGTVTFTIKSGSTTIGTATSGTVAGGAASATFSLSGINAAVYTIEAAYSGATGFNASNNAGQSPAPTLTVNKKVLTIRRPATP